jgi:hypothetical protein
VTVNWPLAGPFPWNHPSQPLGLTCGSCDFLEFDDRGSFCLMHDFRDTPPEERACPLWLARRPQPVLFGAGDDGATPAAMIPPESPASAPQVTLTPSR